MRRGLEAYGQMILHILHLLHRFLLIACTLPRDLCGLYVITRVFLDLQLFKWTRNTISDQVRTFSSRYAERPCLVYEDQVWSFSDVEYNTDLVHRYFYHKYSLEAGDCVGLLMFNHPLYPCVWLGLSRMRVPVALLNTNLKGQQLKHAINSCRCKIVLFESAFSAVIAEFKSSMIDTRFLRLDPTSCSCDEADDVERIRLDDARHLPPVRVASGVSTSDVLFYIFTSGTTGMPKAARITHNRFMLGACGCYHGHRIRSDDIVYNPLPLYHAMGGWLCLSFALLYGNTVVIKRRFSVSSFWKDCVLNNCTFFMYIGEMVRYLLNVEPSPFERFHSIRSGAGNGLRLQAWNSFLGRFGNHIKLIEFYAATEGNAYFFNLEGLPGSCGFNSLIAPWFLPSIVVKIDNQTQSILRDPTTGLCVRCGFDEAGMLLSPIRRNDIWQNFDGYRRQEDTERKIIRNVRRNGDVFFVSGDILRQDDLGYLYFVDRMGDTFRWCGENVSTFEVEDILTKAFSGHEMVIYGIAINGYEGRCGMLATDIVSSDAQEFLLSLYRVVCDNLAGFARPVFVRFCETVETTGTFKLNKQKLKKEGIEREIIGRNRGRFFYLPKGHYQYEELNLSALDDVISGRVAI